MPITLTRKDLPYIYDDFEGPSIDTTKWEINLSGTASATTLNGFAYLTRSSDGSWVNITTKEDLKDSGILCLYLHVLQLDSASLIAIYLSSTTTGSGGAIIYVPTTDSILHKLEIDFRKGCRTRITKYLLNPTDTTFSTNITEVYTDTSTWNNVYLRIQISTGGGAGSQAKIAVPFIIYKIKRPRTI